VPSKATRSEHYLAIAEFYGRQLAEDIRNPNIPEFVILQAARRTAHFALTAARLLERTRARRAASAGVGPWREPGAPLTAISSASPS
jgi:hypothetical protein